MTGLNATVAPLSLAKLLEYLAQDPGNLTLMAQAATTAIAEGNLEETCRLLNAYEAIAPLPASLVNLRGIIAIHKGAFEDASADFQHLLSSNIDAADQAPLYYNLAWAKFRSGDWEGALGALPDFVAEGSAAAANLKVKSLHHLGKVEEALAFGRSVVEIFPHDASLMSSLAVVAIDAEEPGLAAEFAAKGGDSHEALSTLGSLQMLRGNSAQALPFFERALVADPTSARALVGKGLVLLNAADKSSAAEFLERGAQIFGDHLGSWVAAGWARFAAGEYDASRALFDHALEIDDAFAETHGALAVLDMQRGDRPSAERRAEVASRLDSRCFSAALAKSLIAASYGDDRTAQRIRDLALNTAVGPAGETLAQSMAILASKRGA